MVAFDAPFAQHTRTLSITVGSTYSSSNTYLIAGLGFDYYVLSGLALGLNADLWLFGSPTIVNLSPEIRYVLQTGGRLHPYVGAFYRHAFVTDFDDQESIGSRLGLVFVSGRGAALTAGVVYERWLDCSDPGFRSCDTFYPEFSFMFRF